MNILEEAETLINGQRAKDYGDVKENFGRIASLWSSVRGQYFSKHDVAIFMILVKVARQHDLYHRDSMVDIAGYAALDAKIFDDLDQPAPVTQRFGDDIDGFIHDLSSAQSFTPRVWDSLEDVPKDVQVRDNEGDVWSFSSGSWHWTDNRTGISYDEGGVNLAIFDENGPFTEEVLF